MKRRTALFAGTAAAAGAAGLGAALWQRVSAGTELPPNFWSLRFDIPGAEPFALESLRGHPVVINFWATWCAPCVTELPLLDAFYRARQRDGWRVLGLAVDQPAPVQSFLKRHPVGFPTALAGADGLALAGALGNTSGGLPFTVVLNSNGTLAERKLGILKPADFTKWGEMKT